MKIFVRDSGESTEHYFVESDNYSPLGNESEITDIGLCHKYGSLIIGSGFGYMDWKCHRDLMKGLIESKGGPDYSTYVTNLSSEEKEIAAKYVPTKIVGALGFGQLITDSGGSNEAFAHIDFYLEQASAARYLRYKEVVGYVYKWMGKDQALQAEDDVLNNRLKSKYINRGVLKKIDDSVDGFEDWIQSIDGFVTNGLKKKLELSTWILISGAPSIPDFCNKITDCIKDGLYPIS